VTHYFFKDCAYWTPLGSNIFTGKIAFRRQLSDVRTGEVQPNTINGQPIPDAFMDLAAPPVAGQSWPVAAHALRRSLPRRILGRIRRSLAG
jgi:hypothetical protein